MEQGACGTSEMAAEGSAKTLCDVLTLHVAMALSMHIKCHEMPGISQSLVVYKLYRSSTWAAHSKCPGR